MTTKELYTKGARVWVPHPENVWEGAEVTQDFRTGVLIVKSDDGGIIKQIRIESDGDLPPLRNPTILIGENDLTSLSYLHEPAVLHNLKIRFCDLNAIYTYCGIVLVAINPYDELPIYGEETILAYRGQAMGDLDPHIFAVAEEAYTKLEREKRDQSIIVSGESGAGKTVSAKYTMRYFATVGGSSNETQVEKKVLASSPIMEAIGNAKTTRNDNSSRFGKFIEIHFDKNFHIIGASMRTYLLEKSRVVFQASEERNYHIFYQLCSARKQMPDLRLEHQDEFEFLNQGRNPLISGIDDENAFMETKHALNILGFTESEQADMFKIWAAILHLGNIQITDLESSKAHSDDKVEASMINSNDKHLKIFCSLIGVDPKEIAHKLTNRKIISRNEVILKPLNVIEAKAAREALAKHIYAELFNWIVSIANKALRCTQPVNHFIGVLDIYGFETFEINSFEQFCINYANEKLQQQFNSHVFKLEQEEYLREDITWTMIHFYDNQPCIDLIEARLGVLDLLDEECRMPQGSDLSWAGKLYSKCGQSSHFIKPRFGTNAFAIKHFADDVEYQVYGFLEKNRDTVLEEQVEVLKGSKSCTLLKTLFLLQSSSSLEIPQTHTRIKVSPVKPSTPISSASKQNRQSVGAQFRGSLTALMATLNATTPHYVRCIKPNDHKKPFQYDPARAVQQLRACGVLETIRISAAGFPSRWMYQDFFVRYRVLCHSKDINRNDSKATCSKIIEKSIKDEDKYRFGKAKIFFRAGQVAYLEKLRAEHLRKCCIIMQSQLRAYVCRKKYLRIKYVICGLQRYGRGYLARQHAQELRRERAAKILQKHIRCWLAKTKYIRLKRAALGIQKYGRGLLARRHFIQLKYNASAIKIQKFVRGWLYRKRYAKSRRQVIVCQSAIRRFLARKLYKKLRVEARSVEHVKKLNRGLENKIISLQQKIESLQTDNKQITHLYGEIADLKLKLEGMKAFELETKKLKSLVLEKDLTIEKLVEELTTVKANNMELIDEKKCQLDLYQKEKKEWLSESEKLGKKLSFLKETYTVNHEESERLLREQHTIEKKELISELDNEKTAYQRLLHDQYELQSRLDQVQAINKKNSELQRHHRSLSNVSNASQSETADDDFGYVSKTSTIKSENRESLKVGDASLPDPGLVLRLQNYIKQVENDKILLNNQIERLEEDRMQDALTPETNSSKAEDQHRINELEIECTRLKDDLKRLRASVARADGADVSSRELEAQFAAQEEELARRRDECIQLKNILTNQRPWFQALKNVTVNLKSLASSNYGSDVEAINEDGELLQLFEARTRITRQLQDEMLQMKEHFKNTLTEYQTQINNLKKENEDQQQLWTANLTLESQKECLLQYEIAKISTENITLREQNYALSKDCEKYKKEIKMLMKQLNTMGSENRDYPVMKSESKMLPDRDGSILPVVRKKEREEHMGMFEYKSSYGLSDNEVVEAFIIKRLVTDLSPRTAVTLLPGLPAYIIFMCIRYTDHINDEEKVKLMLKYFINGVKKVVKKKGNDLDTTVLWLANTLRLLHCLKQYSGDPSYQDKNTTIQNDQCLRNFDLSEYRQVLSDIAVWIYQGLISLMEKRVHGIIVGTLLEYEEISGVSSGVPRGRAQSVSGGSISSAPETPRNPSHLTDEFTCFIKTLNFFGVDVELIIQIFRQLFYYVCATCLNQLLLRKDLCRWSKGMQIRYNLSYLEVWLKENCEKYEQSEVSDVQKTLNPIIQAVYLLQARKSTADIQSMCDMCPDLTPMQICKILNLYTPAEDFEPTITTEFIRQIQTCLQERNKGKPQNEHANLLMDTKYNFAVKFPFNPSSICLENIELPDALNLYDLLTKL